MAPIALFLKGFKKSVFYSVNGQWNPLDFLSFSVFLNENECVWQIREQRHKVLYIMVSPSNQVIRLLLIFGYMCLVSNCSNHSETWGSFISLFPKLWFIGYTRAASSQCRPHLRWKTFMFLCEWPMLPSLSGWMTWKGGKGRSWWRRWTVFLLGTELWFMSSVSCIDSCVVPKQVLSCMINVCQGIS